METLTLSKNNSGTLLLPMANKTICINIDSIIRIEASSNYSKIYCKGQALPIVVAKVLRWFEERLPQHSFARVHRTHLVNKKYMVGIRNDKVILETGTQIGISRRKRKTCFDQLS
jgi:two-component system LytT family response regulator